MKRLIIFLLLSAALKVAGQTTGYLRFDTVRITKSGGSSELIIVNKTKDTIGILANVGGGLTRFVKPRVLNDTTFVVGLDTLTIKGSDFTASNGLTKTDNDIALGGTLSGNTDIALNSFNLGISGTGAFTFPNGSAASPILKFSGHTSGIYSGGDNNVSIAANGERAASFSTTSLTLGRWENGGTFNLSAPSASGGSNRDGVNLVISSGSSTNSGIAGNMIFRVGISGTGLPANPLINAMAIKSGTGRVVIGGLVEPDDATHQLTVIGDMSVSETPPGTNTDSIIVKGSDNKFYAVAQSDIAGGGGTSGISEVVADFGLINVNDSTLQVDSLEVLSWERGNKIADSLSAQWRVDIKDSLEAFEIESIVHNAGDSGVAMAWASNDSFYIKRINVVGGTIATNADSSVTITVEGGGGGGTPGGSDTQIQYNDDGAFGGTSGMTWNNSNTQLLLTKDALGVTRNENTGYKLVNTTAASSGNQQISPPVILQGNQWNTTSGASHRVNWLMDLLPGQSASGLATFRMAFASNGGSYSDVYTFTSAGNFTTSGIVFGGGFTNGSTGLFRWSSRATIASTADGVIRLGNSTVTDFTRLCFGGTTTSFPALGKSSATLRVELGDGSALTDLEVADETYGSGWNGSNEVPTKNAVYDKIESLGGGGSSPYVYQFISTQQVTVSNTTTETTIYGTGEGSAGIDGSSNITTGTQIVFKGGGTIDTDGSSAGTPTLSFAFPTSTISFPITGLANGLNDAPYTYEYKVIPLGTGTSQSYIWQIDFYCENNFTPIFLKYGGRETGSLTTTGTVTVDVTVEWSAADTDNTWLSDYNTVEIFKK